MELVFKSQCLSKVQYYADLEKSMKNLINCQFCRILAPKQSDPSSDTTALESEVDALVYGLNGLTEEEIAIVEGA